MNWWPSTLKCQIYENNQLLDLKSCSKAELHSLTDAIFEYWKTSEQSLRWYDVDVYEKYHLFKQPTISIEVACFIRKPDSYTGRKQVSISKFNTVNPVGRKLKITPKSTLYRKWTEPVEVAFVV